MRSENAKKIIQRFDLSFFRWFIPGGERFLQTQRHSPAAHTGIRKNLGVWSASSWFHLNLASERFHLSRLNGIAPCNSLDARKSGLRKPCTLRNLNGHQKLVTMTGWPEPVRFEMADGGV